MQYTHHTTSTVEYKDNQNNFVLINEEESVQTIKWSIGY